MSPLLAAVDLELTYLAIVGERLDQTAVGLVRGYAVLAGRGTGAGSLCNDELHDSGELTIKPAIEAQVGEANPTGDAGALSC